MKAYNLSIKDEDDAGQQIVFANTAKEAKKLVHGDLYDQLEEYIDLRVNRAPRFDGMEKLSEAQLALHQWRDGWQWFDRSTPDPDETSDAAFFRWYNDNFGDNS